MGQGGASEPDGVARTVQLSYRAADGKGTTGTWPRHGDRWVADRLDDPSYRPFLRRAHAGPIAVGEEWEKVVSRGCAPACRVLFKVEAIAGAAAIDPATECHLEHRRGVRSGWG